MNSEVDYEENETVLNFLLAIISKKKQYFGPYLEK